MPLLQSVIPLASVIDSRNQNLWNGVLAEYEVQVAASANDEHGCYTQGTTAILYVPPEAPCHASFAHELLHIYIRQQNVFIGANLKNTVGQDSILSKIFVPALIEHVGNCLDHIKMFPIYSAMGFEREKFLLDYSTPKCTDQEIRDIQRYYKTAGRIYTKAAEVYTGKYFGIQADPNNDFVYTQHLAALRRVDEGLFRVLENLIIAWKELDIERDDPLDSYLTIGWSFYDELKKWTDGKQFL